ncbi:putative Metacaspase [Triangularia verruculosa]|uniref:Metacaspase n=1 Tax=Triangularia verruculosa TaxID=2587418 RepID=A0AAN6XIV4_9PEZI|nr:putative Metacaspase [Triangularia verruculosa]
MSPTESGPQRWALLIGIDFYIPDGNGQRSYPNLRGCVNDIGLIASFLQAKMGMAPGNIVKLTSTNATNSTYRLLPPEDPSSRPTRDNIIKAFQDLAEKAPGDLVYIHYSGHGAQLPTAYHSTNPTARDEALVPADVYINGGAYIRDREIAGLLQRLVDADLNVTLVLDCCQSGSGNRYAQYDGVRGLGMVDDTPVSSSTDVTCRVSPTTDCFRGAELRSNWALEASGYFFIAACTSSQKAREKEFSEQGNSTSAGRGPYGALTYSLIETLQQQPDLSSPPLSQLIEDIRIKVERHSSDQTPSLEGNAKHAIPFFGSCATRKAAKGGADMRVKLVDIAAGIVHFNRGHFHGVELEAEYEVYPEMSLPGEGARSTIVRVDSVEDLVSRGRVVTGNGTIDLAVKLGSRARLKQVSRHSQLERVGFVHSGTKTSVATEDVWMEEFRQHAKSRDCSYWNCAEGLSEDTKLSFYLERTEGGVFHFLGRDKVQLNNIPPVIHHEGCWPDDIAAVLDHITTFNRAQRLGINPIPQNLRDQCSFELLGKAREAPNYPEQETGQELHTNPYQGDVLETVKPLDGVYQFRGDEFGLFRFRNTGKSSVHLTLFMFGDSWSIERTFPEGEGSSEEVKAGEERYLAIEFEVPEGRAVDTVRAIITKTPTSLDGFELPSIQTLFSQGYDRKGGPECLPELGDKWQVYDVTISTSVE